MINLYIIVPVYNRKVTTLSFLENIFKQTFDLFNVVIVDDGSTDETAEEIKIRYPHVFIVKGTGNWWWTKSVNEGIKFALNKGAQRVLLMNDDTTFNKKYLKILLNDSADKQIIGSLSLVEGYDYRIFFSGVYKINSYTAKTFQYHNKFTDLEKPLSGVVKSVGLPGRGLLINKDVFLKIGFFDEKKLPQYKADTDFVLRAYKAKIDTYISYNAIIYCDIEKTGNGSSFIETSLINFLKSYFSKYSHNSIYSNFNFIKKHAHFITFPFAFLRFLLFTFLSFLKNYLKKCVHKKK